MTAPDVDHEKLRQHFELVAGRSLTVAEELRTEARRLLRQADRLSAMGEAAQMFIEMLPEPEPEPRQPMRVPNPHLLTPEQRLRLAGGDPA